MSVDSLTPFDSQASSTLFVDEEEIEFENRETENLHVTHFIDSVGGLSREKFSTHPKVILKIYLHLIFFRQLCDRVVGEFLLNDFPFLCLCTFAIRHLQSTSLRYDICTYMRRYIFFVFNSFNLASIEVKVIKCVGLIYAAYKIIDALTSSKIYIFLY